MVLLLHNCWTCIQATAHCHYASVSCSDLVSAASKCNNSVTAGFEHTLKCTLFSHYDASVPENVDVIPVQSC